MNATVTVVVLPVTLNITGKLYNLEPQPGEPARFGIVLHPVDPLPLLPVILESAVELRQTDFGLDTVIEDIPNMTSGIPTHINSMHVTLFGNPPGGTKPFIRNPTSCGTATTNFTADAIRIRHRGDWLRELHADRVRRGAVLADVHGFGRLPRPHRHQHEAARHDVDPAGLRRGRPEAGSRAPADQHRLRHERAQQSMRAGGLPGRRLHPSTVSGSALASSPLLTEPLTGPVIVVGNPGGLPRIGLDLTGPLAMKLTGDFVTSPSAGLEFAGLPDIPIADFSLTFEQDRLVINLTSLCDGVPRTFNTTFDGHNGATQAGSTAATIKGLEGCGAQKGVKGGKCKKKGKKKRKGKAAAAKKKKKKKCKRKKRRKKK